jgi:hypothetical protein
MRLHDVANRFNNMVCWDAYSGLHLFDGQLGLYDDNKRDSETAERRTLSLAPTATIPARRVIQAANTRFIVGHGNPDDWAGSTIRVGYTVHEATYLSIVRTLDQACLGLAGYTAYAGRAWVKDLSYTQQSSKETPQHHIHFSRSEPVEANQLVTFEGRLNLVRSTNYGAGGTLVTTCEEMVEPAIESAQVFNGTFDPIADAFIGAPVLTNVVRMRWQSLFTYSSSIAPKFQPGDIQLAVSQSVGDVKAGTEVTLSDGIWRVLSAVREGSVWLCRAARHG